MYCTIAYGNSLELWEFAAEGICLQTSSLWEKTYTPFKFHFNSSSLELHCIYKIFNVHVSISLCIGETNSWYIRGPQATKLL